jgi:hypothetical protein
MWLITDQIKSKQCHFDVNRFSASLMFIRWVTLEWAKTGSNAICRCNSSMLSPEGFVVGTSRWLWWVPDVRDQYTLTRVRTILWSSAFGVKRLDLDSRGKCNVWWCYCFGDCKCIMVWFISIIVGFFVIQWLIIIVCVAGSIDFVSYLRSHFLVVPGRMMFSKIIGTV